MKDCILLQGNLWLDFSNPQKNQNAIILFSLDGDGDRK